MQKVIITGITGSLGQALGKEYMQKGWHVVGVSRKRDIEKKNFNELLVNKQQDEKDARQLLDQKADLIILNAGQIETEVGEQGVPLVHMIDSINTVNYSFPAKIATMAAEHVKDKELDVVVIGSIADQSPSCFGPIYHSSKMGIHYLVSSIGPIVNSANPLVRIKLYRPGVIYGPLSWAPAIRLNDKALKIRAARCQKAPQPEVIAKRVIKFVGSKKWIGSDPSPISFHVLKFLFMLMPNLFYRIQILGWRKGSRFADKAKLTQTSLNDPVKAT